MRNFSLGLLSLCLLASCGTGADKEADKTAAAPAETAAFTSKNTDAFNQSFDHLLSTYYSLRDAFVEYDTAKVNSASQELSADAGSVKLEELKTDSTGTQRGTAKKYADTVKLAAGRIQSEGNWEKKQRSFETLSDAMFHLARTVKYDKQKIYVQHCPMAFNNEGASWISSSSEIVNPYMGKKHPKYKAAMLECGEIPDSLDLRQ